MVDLSGVRASAGLGALIEATGSLEPPYAVIDLGAFAHNARDMARRAGATPIRVASKSVRCRELVEAVLALPGYRGILAFTLPEAIWLAGQPGNPAGPPDVVVGYPTADAHAIARLAADDALRSHVTLMVDSIEHVDFIAKAAAQIAAPIRVCLDLDASLRYLGGRVHLGTRRSPTHSFDDALALARAIVDRAEVTLVGLMSYEGQIAGVGDNQPGSALKRAQIRAMQHLSRAELRGRRAAVVNAISDLSDLEFVNGGGTGSLEYTAADPSVTEIAAGSGLFAPALFDNYRAFHPIPAAYFVLPVVRRPTEDIATVLGGGWVASGAAGPDRLPSPVWPRGLTLSVLEGAGEVQTPLRGDAARSLSVGDRVWLRHAKAGELCERVNELHLVDRGRIVCTVATYRGEGRAFA